MDIEHSHKNLAEQYDYNCFEAEDGNYVWAGALTLAWHEMAKLANVKNL